MSRPTRIIELSLEVGILESVIFDYAFKTDKIADEIYGAIQRMCNRHYTSSQPPRLQLGMGGGDNYAIAVIWNAPYRADVCAKLWDRIINAAEFRTLYDD